MCLLNVVHLHLLFIRSLQMSDDFHKSSFFSHYVTRLYFDDGMRRLLVPGFSVCSPSAPPARHNTYPVMCHDSACLCSLTNFAMWTVSLSRTR